MNIFVSGGTGFVGRNLVWALAQAGHQVTFSGRNRKAALLVLGKSILPTKFLEMDHSDPAFQNKLQHYLRSMDVVIHNAALSSPWGTYDQFHRANVEATHLLLQASKIAGISKFIYLSTPTVYFKFEDLFNIAEESTLPSPVNFYAKTKLDGENLVASSGIPQTIIFRPRAIFGPWDTTLFPRLLRVMKLGKVPIFRNGQIWTDLTFIDNLTAAALLSLKHNTNEPVSIFNISNGTPIQITSLFEYIKTYFDLDFKTINLPHTPIHILASLFEKVSILTKNEPLFTPYSIGTLAFSQTLNISKAKQILGYKPLVTIEEGIARTANWWTREGGL
ncbi:NAD(P)-dependent oxidoreductase [bacterium]|nr:NAD(P)-dependent oxidoreductase [bacterium]